MQTYLIVRDGNGSDFCRIRFLAPSLLDLDFFCVGPLVSKRTISTWLGQAVIVVLRLEGLGKCLSRVDSFPLRYILGIGVFLQFGHIQGYFQSKQPLRAINQIFQSKQLLRSHEPDFSTQTTPKEL